MWVFSIGSALTSIKTSSIYITDGNSCWVLLHIESFPGYTEKFNRPWELLSRRGTWSLPLSGVTYHCPDDDQPSWLFLGLKSTKSSTICLPVTLTLTRRILFLFWHSSTNQGREVDGVGVGGVGGNGLKNLYFNLPIRPIHSAFSVLKSPPLIQLEDPAYGDLQACIWPARNSSFIINCNT